MSANPDPSKPYHHGNLRDALLTAARDLLEADGHSALSLRKCAEAVGVSATAPQNHFQNKAGLLTALAAQGYAEMAVYMRRGLHEGADRKLRREAALLGYVAFAEDNPALYELMFSRNRVSSQDPDLLLAVRDCFVTLADVSQGLGDFSGTPEQIAARQQMYLWSVVHGYAQLLTANRFKKDDMQGTRITDILPGF
ncbi:MAG: TetR/AcrR family transcriptional regulator [Pseudomonadota bacterium]